MSWYHFAKKKRKQPKDFLKKIWEIFGIDIETGKILDIPSHKKKKDCREDYQHSVDIRDDGGDGE